MLAEGRFSGATMFSCVLRVRRYLMRVTMLKGTHVFVFCEKASQISKSK